MAGSLCRSALYLLISTVSAVPRLGNTIGNVICVSYYIYRKYLLILGHLIIRILKEKEFVLFHFYDIFLLEAFSK